MLTNKIVNNDVQEPRPCDFNRQNICNEGGEVVAAKAWKGGRKRY
uniref:Uncharacterized protein n=1 Tax=Arundo donax TaxID=35708 RepID=A0A0A9CWU2_ARUDO